MHRFNYLYISIILCLNYHESTKIECALVKSINITILFMFFDFSISLQLEAKEYYSYASFTYCFEIIYCCNFSYRIRMLSEEDNNRQGYYLTKQFIRHSVPPIGFLPPGKDGLLVSLYVLFLQPWLSTNFLIAPLFIVSHLTGISIH